MPDEWVVDIHADAGDVGRAILAPEDGSVIVNANGSDGGAIVITWVSANGSEKICVGHLQDIVKTGPVSSGDLIAHEGSSGATNAHMHVVRQVNGAPAPLVLSGHTITPAMSPWDYGSNGTPYTSSGPVAATSKLQPITGDWNGDGKTDIGLRRISTGMFYFRTGPSWRQTSVTWSAGAG
jgi:murein DD-endopeptidase MepM/ murein hydrolase activator NlpD